MNVGRSRSVSTDAERAYAAVAAALWAEREALEQALFKMEEERSVILSGSSRFLHKADDELRSALADLHAREVLRAIEVDSLEEALGLDARTTLAELAETAPPPWSVLLTEHRALLGDLVQEVESIARANSQLLHAGATGAADISVLPLDGRITTERCGLPIDDPHD